MGPVARGTSARPRRSARRGWVQFEDEGLRAGLLQFEEDEPSGDQLMEPDAATDVLQMVRDYLAPDALDMAYLAVARSPIQARHLRDGRVSREVRFVAP